MKALSTLLVLLLAFPASAELKHIPPWKMCGDKACYEFEDAKKLLVLDADLEALIQKDKLWTKLQFDLEESVKQTNLALAAEKRIHVTLLARNTELESSLLKETERANKAEAKPGPFPGWLIGAGIGVGVGIVAGILLGVYVAK